MIWMKRTFKGTKAKRALRFAETHRRRVGKNYTECWAEDFTKQLQSEWAKKHPTDETPKKSDIKKPNQNK